MSSLYEISLKIFHIFKLDLSKLMQILNEIHVIIFTLLFIENIFQVSYNWACRIFVNVIHFISYCLLVYLRFLYIFNFKFYYQTDYFPRWNNTIFFCIKIYKQTSI